MLVSGQFSLVIPSPPGWEEGVHTYWGAWNRWKGKPRSRKSMIKRFWTKDEKSDWILEGWGVRGGRSLWTMATVGNGWQRPDDGSGVTWSEDEDKEFSFKKYVWNLGWWLVARLFTAMLPTKKSRIPEYLASFTTSRGWAEPQVYSALSGVRLLDSSLSTHDSCSHPEQMPRTSISILQSHSLPHFLNIKRCRTRVFNLAWLQRIFVFSPKNYQKIISSLINTLLEVFCCLFAKNKPPAHKK